MDKEHKSLPEAIAAAVQSDAKHGRLGGLKPARAGTRETNPLDIPRAKDGSVDKSQMKDGNWYNTPDGPGVYDAAKGGVVVPDSRDDEDDE
jgi:hypothetical protein